MHICIALVLKDAERYLQSFLFRALDEIESYYKYKHTFSYVVYESNSSDYTAEFIKMFAKLEHRDGRVHFYTQPTNTDLCEKNGSGSATGSDYGTRASRIHRICDARNAMLSMFRDKLCMSDWTLFIDNNVYFEVDYIKQMLHHASHASIITCNSVQLSVNTGTNSKEVPYVTNNHYYDTYSCVDIDYNLDFTRCISSACKWKPCMESIVPKWNNVHNVVEVQSAWGGFVLVNSKAFMSDNVVWETATLDNMPLLDGNTIKFAHQGDGEGKTNAICEHIMFCNKIKNALDKPVVIMTDIIPYRISARIVSARTNESE